MTNHILRNLFVWLAECMEFMNMASSHGDFKTKYGAGCAFIVQTTFASKPKHAVNSHGYHQNENWVQSWRLGSLTILGIVAIVSFAFVPEAFRMLVLCWGLVNKARFVWIHALSNILQKYKSYAQLVNVEHFKAFTRTCQEISLQISSIASWRLGHKLMGKVWK